MILSKQFQLNEQQMMDTSNPQSNGNNLTPYEDNYQVDISSTTFELETVTASYVGLMRIYRLSYIADHCSALRQEALLACLKYIQETHFTTFYKKVSQP